jgi:hypothetical protein
MPGIVEPCFAHSSTSQERLPGVIVSTRIDRVAGPVGEDSAVLDPQLARSLPLVVLFLLVCAKQLDQSSATSGRQDQLNFI